MSKLSNFYRLVQNENMKIVHRPRTWAMVGVLILSLLSLTAILKIDQNPNIQNNNWKQHLIEMNQRLQQQIDENSAGASQDMKLQLEGEINKNLYYIEHNVNPYEVTIWSVVNGASSLLVLITLLTVIVAADMLAAEYSWGTIKLLLVGPASRTKILFSKYISTLLFALFLLVLNFIASFVLGGIVDGFGAVSRPSLAIGAGGMVEEGSMLIAVVQNYGFKAIELMMYVTMAFMISASFRSSSMAIAFSLLFMLLGNSMVSMLSKYEWVKYLLFANVNLSQHISGTPIRPDMTMLFSVSVLLVYFAAFHFVSWIVFTKRDVAG
ncbi:ABC transporter permease [Paenibacillus apiarius]|uniref:ABC transporter permease n=1 Tax=Paenibacillus apiarius TaxID=46240 RepID=A0ABT4DTD3_9BACL|nr:ABC transporter permease [Paenibacillus apiarius]MCY9515656.1 ABC transporter permease [Paenibacillus apiarius]MCY9519271.1 ABC transporter permease [Paenibacillus apiarius]MCY9550907.1 ABC transporter permease [Paenibacillus apiarius]MCY9559001.1 ABC transporter permease [Paenibacillus apiarius]MCY9683522.1 ABC transporter permease [Paenibacillus apiarius]